MAHDDAKMRHYAPSWRVDSVEIALLCKIPCYEREYQRIRSAKPNTSPILFGIKQIDRD
jgi:hypothetical protein